VGHEAVVDGAPVAPAVLTGAEVAVEAHDEAPDEPPHERAVRIALKGLEGDDVARLGRVLVTRLGGAPSRRARGSCRARRSGRGRRGGGRRGGGRRRLGARRAALGGGGGGRFALGGGPLLGRRLL